MGLGSLLLAGGAMGASADDRESPEWASLPRDASLVVVVRADRDEDGGDLQEVWANFLLESLGETVVPVEQGWAEARELLSRAVPSSRSHVHVVGDAGRSWLQLIRWRDAVALEEGLRELRIRPMGGGRFRSVDPPVDLVLAPPWLVVGPWDCRWLEPTADRLGRMNPDSPTILSPKDEGAASLEVEVRHSQPTGGATRLAVHPVDATTARVEVHGRYDASPFPIRTTQVLERSPLDGLRGRLAFAVHESGIGLLDPLIVEHAPSIPALVPELDLRRRFAPRRIVVVDGESVVIQGVGPIEVPAICVAVPLREPVNSKDERRALESGIDRWLETAGMAVRATWDPGDRTEREVMRRDDIRHLTLGPRFLEAAGGHPMAMGASLDWTLRIGEEDGSGWVVVGSAPGLVRRVAEGLERSSDTDAIGSSTPIAMQGVASPARLALQLRDLALLRRETDDAVAERDATTLERLSRWMSRLDRIRWETTRQDAQEVRGRGWIRLAEHSVGDDPDRSDGPNAGGGR